MQYGSMRCNSEPMLVLEFRNGWRVKNRVKSRLWTIFPTTRLAADLGSTASCRGKEGVCWCGLQVAIVRGGTKSEPKIRKYEAPGTRKTENSTDVDILPKNTRRTIKRTSTLYLLGFKNKSHTTYFIALTVLPFPRRHVQQHKLFIHMTHPPTHLQQ